jgi:outer membrane protein OmpA-like peptidoglycan-associated protein
MRKKYYITESQMEKIVLHVKNGNNREVIKEGWKEVALGAALLLGATFGGNKATAQTANNAINQTKILHDIKNTLEDSTGVEKLANFIKLDLDKLLNYMKNNADQIESDFEEAAKKNKVNLQLQLKDIRNQKGAIKGKLQQGYAVTDVIVHSDTILVPNTMVELTDTIKVDYSAEAMFVSGKFQLKPEIMNDISNQIEIFKAGGGVIVGVNIESSTDKEPIKIGNETLAQKRAESVSSFLSSIGVQAETNITTLPNSGPNVYKKGMSSEERKSAREETAKYRYVTVEFYVQYLIPSTSKKDTILKIKDWIEVEMVNSSVYKKGGSVKLKGGNHFKTTTNKFKCNKVKGKGGAIPCSFGQGGKTKTNMGWTNL